MYKGGVVRKQFERFQETNVLPGLSGHESSKPKSK